MRELTILLGTIALGTGAVVILSNPSRTANRVFFMGAIAQFGWIACILEAIRAGKDGDLGQVELLLRLNAQLAGFFPFILWLTRESIADLKIVRGRNAKLMSWLSTPLLFCSLTLHPSFLHRTHDSAYMERGWAYYLYQSILISLYAILVIDTIRMAGTFHGRKRVETQFFVLNLAIGSLLAAALTAFGNAYNSSALKRMSIAAFLAVYLVSGWAITAHKIFDLKQIINRLFQRATSILIPSIIVAILISFDSENEFRFTNHLIITSLAMLMAFWIDQQSKRQFDLDGARQQQKIRELLMRRSLGAKSIDELVENIKGDLKSEFSVNKAEIIHFSNNNSLATLSLSQKPIPALEALFRTGWATPEGIVRKRRSENLSELDRYLSTNNFGAIVSTPEGSNSPSLIIALGEKAHSWPFTYPEIQRLQNISCLIESIISQAQLTAQRTTSAKIEQLEVVGKGLAHDLRNLLTPISSFLLHTEELFKAGSDEQRVHHEAVNSVEVMSAYVREALFFSQKLEPEFTVIRISHLLSSISTLFGADLRKQNLSLICEGNKDITIRGDFMLIHRMIANLLKNAIDASPLQGKIYILYSLESTGGVRIQVVDEGSGIEPENFEKVFEPYFTTKNGRDPSRGFGLGLTICRRIAQIHSASIQIERSTKSGTCFSVHFFLQR